MHINKTRYIVNNKRENIFYKKEECIFANICYKDVKIMFVSVTLLNF